MATEPSFKSVVRLLNPFVFYDSRTQDQLLYDPSDQLRTQESPTPMYMVTLGHPTDMLRRTGIDPAADMSIHVLLALGVIKTPRREMIWVCAIA